MSSGRTPGAIATGALLAGALGILIAFLAFLIWPNPGEGRGLGIEAAEPTASPPPAPAR